MATETAPAPTVPADERVRAGGALSRLLSRPELGAARRGCAGLRRSSRSSPRTQLRELRRACVDPQSRGAARDPRGRGCTPDDRGRVRPLDRLDPGVRREWRYSSWSRRQTRADTDGRCWPAVGVALVLVAFTGVDERRLVNLTKLPSFIITLGTLFIFRGLTIAVTRALTNRTQLSGLDEVAGVGWGSTRSPVRDQDRAARRQIQHRRSCGGSRWRRWRRGCCCGRDRQLDLRDGRRPSMRRATSASRSIA